MKRQRWNGICSKRKKVSLVMLALTGLLVLIGATGVAACPDVSAQDISLGEEIGVTVTHCVINMTGFNFHRVVITGPDGYYGEHRFQTPPGSHTFHSPSCFPTPTVAGEYVVTFQFGVKLWIWWLWDDDSMVQTTFTVSGGTPPTITCPGDITTVTDPGVCGAVVTWPATGAGDPEPTVTCTPASGSFFPQGTTTVTCTATNEFGSASCSFQLSLIHI